jgi:hypothetical protein
MGATTCRNHRTNVLLTFTRVRYTVSRLTQSVAPPSLMWMGTSYLERFLRTKAKNSIWAAGIVASGDEASDSINFCVPVYRTK